MSEQYQSRTGSLNDQLQPEALAEELERYQRGTKLHANFTMQDLLCIYQIKAQVMLADQLHAISNRLRDGL